MISQDVRIDQEVEVMLDVEQGCADGRNDQAQHQAAGNRSICE